MCKVHIPYNETSLASSMYVKYITNELKSKLPTVEFITEGLSNPTDLGDNEILLVIIDGPYIDIRCFYSIINALILKKIVIMYSKDEKFKLSHGEEEEVEWVNNLLEALKEIKVTV